MILNTTATVKKIGSQGKSKAFEAHDSYENSVNHMIETCVTIKQQWCCVTLMTADDMVIKFCTGIIQKFRRCCRILTANSENKENKVSFGTLPPCRLSEQANKISKGTSQSLFAKLTVKSPVAVPCFEIPTQSLKHILNGR